MPYGERPGPTRPDPTRRPDPPIPRRKLTPRDPPLLKMPRGGALLLAALLLAALSATLGSPVKEKRGWTLNSAGYLLGPNAVDKLRSFHGKLGLAGKQDQEDGMRAETGALVPMLPSAASWEDTEQSALREPGKALSSQAVRF